MEISLKEARKLGEKLKHLRLSGWQRIGILLTPLWLIVAYSVSLSLSRHHTVGWWYEATNLCYKLAPAHYVGQVCSGASEASYASLITALTRADAVEWWYVSFFTLGPIILGWLCAHIKAKRVYRIALILSSVWVFLGAALGLEIKAHDSDGPYFFKLCLDFVGGSQEYYKTCVIDYFNNMTKSSKIFLDTYWQSALAGIAIPIAIGWLILAAVLWVRRGFSTHAQ